MMNFLLFISLFACNKDVLLTSGELGRLNYVLQSNHQIDEFDLSAAKIATGYEQRISADLTIDGWKMVGEEGYMMYHSSPDDMSVDSESVLDGQIGVPGFTFLADVEGRFLIESKLRDELVDQIHLNFVTPDEISVLSWVRSPNSDEFVEKEGENITVSVGSQAAFIPIPKYEGNRIIGDVNVEISIDPPEAASVGYNIESVGEKGVEASSSPASIYFIQEGTVLVGATDVINNVTTYQEFTVE
jgi:hypothetical protein